MRSTALGEQEEHCRQRKSNCEGSEARDSMVFSRPKLLGQNELEGGDFEIKGQRVEGQKESSKNSLLNCVSLTLGLAWAFC